MSNICFILYDFSQQGGAERAAAKLMNELCQQHQITLISAFNKFSPSYQIDKRVSVIKVVNGDGHILKNIRRIANCIRKTIREKHIDYVLSIDVATALMGVVGTLGTRAKLIVCDRSSCFNEDMYSHKNLRLYAWLGVHACYKYQVMTKEGKRGVVEKYHINPRKVVVIPNWIDRNAVRNNDYQFANNKIISVGRATPEKNYETLIKIAKEIKPKAEGWEWHIYGNFDTPYGQTLLKKIKEEQLDNFLIHKGVSNHIYDLYANYSMFVLTSRFEGMPNVLLEARGSKLPVLAFDCKTGPSELIDDGVNGYLVPLNDIELMSERILSLINDQKLSEKLSSHSYDGMENYSKGSIMKKWNKLLV